MTCRNCHTDNVKEAIYCEKCGMLLSRKPPRQPPAKTHTIWK